MVERPLCVRVQRRERVDNPFERFERATPLWQAVAMPPDLQDSGTAAFLAFDLPVRRCLTRRHDQTGEVMRHPAPQDVVR